MSSAGLFMRIVHEKRKMNKWLRFLLVLIALAILTAWAFYNGLTLRQYAVKSDKIDSGSVRIVVISDLHSHIWGKDQQPLLDMVEAQQPDIIALTGDIVDDREPMYGAQLFLDSVTDIAPTYYVSGNHEWWSGAYDEIKEMIEGCGITVLSNESKCLVINGVALCLYGIDDPEVFDYTDDAALLNAGSINGLLQHFPDLNKDTYNILLAHRPEFIDTYLKYGFDLILSGHTHGGQVRVPLLVNGLFAPDQGWFPPYAGGRYDFGTQTLIVSRGAGVETKLPRIFDPPEVVVVDIAGKE